MIDSIVAAGHTLARRAVEDGSGNLKYDLPAWSFIVFLVDAIVFLPAFLVVGYTLSFLYPTLAMVEDPNPPAYDPVPLNADSDYDTDSPVGASERPSKPTRGQEHQLLVTASLRRTNRLLYSIGGWRASFRGLGCAAAAGLATAFVSGIFTGVPFVPTPVGTLLARLALVQISAAWVHIVLTPPSPLRFWRRLPAFRRAFEATCFPVFISWVATTAQGVIPMLVARAMGMQVWDPRDPSRVPAGTTVGATVGQGIVVLLVTLALSAFLVIPAHAVLVRVQASLLPADADTIVPFDRSYEGRVEPEVVTGKGYVTMRDAFRTISRASWVRFYVLYAKIFAASLVIYAALAVVIVPELVVILKHSTPSN